MIENTGKSVPVHISRRHLALTIGFGIAVLALLVAPVRAAAQPPPPNFSVPYLVDGTWMAFVSSGGPITGEGYSGTIDYTGGSDFTSDAGILAGSWNLVGVSAFSGECYEGTAKIDIVGLVEGTNQIPVLRQNGIRGTGTRHDTCSGQTQTGDVPVGGVGLNAEVTLTDATCEVVIGEFSIPENLSLVAGQASGFLVADFVATRVDALRSDRDPYARSLAQLQSEADAFAREVESGGSSLAFENLWALLDRAEELNRDLRRTAGPCPWTAEGGFVNSLQNVVRGLIDLVLAHPERFGAQDIHALISAALRTGVIGSGATNPEAASEIEAALARELQIRVETDECGELDMIMTAANTLGNLDLLGAALVRSGAVCGGG